MHLPRFKFPQPGRVYISGRLAHLPRITAKFRVRITNRGHRIANYMWRWEKSFLHRAGASLKTYIITRFKRVAGKRKKGPPYEAEPGHSPHLHKPKSEFIRIALGYHVDYTARETIVGPTYSVAKLWGWKHEYGKKYKGAQYPKRAFMGPEFRRWIRIGCPVILRDIRSKMYKNK